MAGYISRDSSSLDLTSGAVVSATNTSEAIFCTYCLLLFQFKQSLITLVANFCGWNRSCMISSKLTSVVGIEHASRERLL
jgi:hypothetical protein